MFIPKRIIFEKKSLEYEIGKKIYMKFKDNENIEMINMSSTSIKKHIPNEDLQQFYQEGKSTLVVGVKKGFKFQSCKPSAHYQLPLLSGCTGQCQYCYLNTNLSDKPYIKVNVNIDDILDKAQNYIDERLPDVTIFEGSATSDPVPVEPYTTLLKQTIEFFAESENGRFRFVTKYDDIDELLDIEHNGKTEIRFTINTQKVITDFENRTASINKRIEASRKVMSAGYPVGFIIAPVFMYDGWKEDYREMMIQLSEKVPTEIKYPLTFEVISHRYTPKAKSVIDEIFPDNILPMVDEDRTYKYGQFGYGKYVYNKEQIAEMKEFFSAELKEIFPQCEIKYII